MNTTERQRLMYAIATREGTAKQLANAFNMTIQELQAFLERNRPGIALIQESLAKQLEAEEESDEPTPADLDDLWISKKIERLHRYQVVANKLFQYASEGTVDATILRELRFFMTAAANELGQLLHRGAGESGTDSLNVSFDGVNMDNLT